MKLDSLLTARWNNRFTAGLGLIFFAFIFVALLAALPAGDSFTGLVLIGCMF
jgi:hypothetical protein